MTEIELTIDGPLARATFRTEGGLNALSGAVLDRVYEVAQEVRAATDVRTLIVAATGKVFVAGADIKELVNLDAPAAKAISERGNRAFDALAALPCVTIARLHGATLGGGLEVVLACDFRFALSGVKVGLPESSLGLIPGWKGVSRVRALGGLAAVRRLTFGASLVSGTEAQAMGLVDGVVETEAELDAMIAEKVESLRRGSPHAIAMLKGVLRGGDETQAFADCFAHNESQEGMAAFIEKRSAKWM